VQEKYTDKICGYTMMVQLVYVTSIWHWCISCVWMCR